MVGFGLVGVGLGLVAVGWGWLELVGLGLIEWVCLSVNQTNWLDNNKESGWGGCGGW